MSQFPNPTSPSSSAPAGSGQLVLIGLVIAVVAVILMNVYVEMRVAAEKEDTITYFRFVDSMKAGDEIDVSSDLVPVKVPVSMREAFGSNAVSEDPDRPGTPLDGDGNNLNTAVVKNQMLTFSLFRNASATAPRDPAFRGLDEITLNIDSKKQPTNLRPGDLVDLYASVPLNRNSEYMRVMEYVKVVNLGDRIQESGSTRGKTNKYGSITIYVDPSLTNKLFDIQKRVDGQTFNVTRRDPQDRRPRELKTGGSKEINERVLDILNLD
ncbi:MAG: hypothetical protein AB8C95_02140 [Phycisphaeraceae bacterium]